MDLNRLLRVKLIAQNATKGPREINIEDTFITDFDDLIEAGCFKRYEDAKLFSALDPEFVLELIDAAIEIERMQPLIVTAKISPEEMDRLIKSMEHMPISCSYEVDERGSMKYTHILIDGPPQSIIEDDSRMAIEFGPMDDVKEEVRGC
jgi:hypothetical protein